MFIQNYEKNLRSSEQHLVNFYRIKIVLSDNLPDIYSFIQCYFDKILLTSKLLVLLQDECSGIPKEYILVYKGTSRL